MQHLQRLVRRAELCSPARLLCSGPTLSRSQDKGEQEAGHDKVALQEQVGEEKEHFDKSRPGESKLDGDREKGK